MPYCIGVDLGTTSVTAAVCDRAGVRVLTLGDRTADTPAAVYLQHDGMLITGRRAASKSVTNPGRVARRFTRLLGSPEPVVIGGRPFTPPELLGVLLGNVVHHVTALEGAPPDAAVLTHPVGWGPAQLDLLREVAGGVGLAEVELVSGPAAVAAHWAAANRPGPGGPSPNRPGPNRPGPGGPSPNRPGSDGAGSPAAGDGAVAVYDLGGGTFDAAVLRGPDLSPVDGAVGRDLGGMDFDELLVGLIDAHLGGALSALDASDPSNATALARIHQDCIRAKEALSGVPEAYVPVFLPGRHTDVRVRRADLEKLVGDHIRATADELVGVLDSAEVAAADLAAVLLVGGSARIPLVARTVSERLGRAVTVDPGSAFAVAAGAALIGGAARGWPVGGSTVSTDAVDAGVEAAATDDDQAGVGPTFGTTAVARGRHAGPPAKETGPSPDQAPSDADEPTAPVPSPRVPSPRAASPLVSPNLQSPNPPSPNPRSLSKPAPGPPSSPADVAGPRSLPLEPTHPARMFPAGMSAARPAPTPRTLPPAPPADPEYAARQARRRRLVTIAGGVLAVLVVTLWLVRPLYQAPPEPSNAALVLTANTLHAADSFYAYASGFEPGELVVLSRNGPTNGVLGAGSKADEAGSVRLGPVKERDLPGDYQIVARGEKSGRTATARLEVLPSLSGD